MKKSKQVILVSGLLFTMLLAGCSKVPQEEIDKANAAIEAAKTAGAETYNAESFAALNDSMKVVMENIEAGKSKFLKSYGDSKEKLAAITATANEVEAETVKIIDSLKAQIQATIAEVNTLLEENRQLISEAPRGKEGTSALNAIRNEISMIETSVAEATSMFENADYQGANDRTMASKEKAVAINAELKEVIAKYKAAVKAR